VRAQHARPWTSLPTLTHKNSDTPTNDVTQALPLIDGLRIGALIGDKAHDADALVAHLTHIGARVVIPPRSNRLHQRPYSKTAYRRRNLIERWFCRIKQFRRIATRYDKLAERFISFICLAASVCRMQ
jgi:transposase